VIEVEDALSALRWPLPEFRQVVDSRTIAVVLRLFLFLFFLFSSRVFSNPLLCEVIFSSLPARHRHRLAALLLFPDINYVRGPHVATVDPPVCVSHLHEGGPGARLVIPRRGRRNPCVRSLRSYKVQFKKILSSLVSTARSRYTLPSSFLLRVPSF